MVIVNYVIVRITLYVLSRLKLIEIYSTMQFRANSS